MERRSAENVSPPVGFYTMIAYGHPLILLARQGKKRLIFKGVCGIQDFINKEGEKARWIER